jgi:DNA-binding LytR/AlgR family response regulator
MHIAVCNNLIADRKQLERLFKRESDSNNNTEFFHLDLFGSKTLLMESPILYHIYILDMAEGSQENLSIAQYLRKKGIASLLALCNVTGLTAEQLDSISPYTILEKPLKPSAINALITQGISLSKTLTIPIEIRGDKETVYILEADILYISYHKKYSTIYKTDGSFIQFLCKIEDLIFPLEDHPSFYISRNGWVININYIENLIGSSVMLTNKTVLKIPFFDRHYLKQLLQQHLESNKKNFVS